MYLEHLSLFNFKNIEQLQLDFSAGINGLVGDNGAGKSNILDAIYYLSMSKSMLPITDGQNIRHGGDYFMLDGSYITDDKRCERVSCSYTTQRSSSVNKGGKVLKRNGKEYEKLSEHVGLLPVVVVSPYDTALISDSAEERRRFLNLLISQYDSGYLSALIRYNALLLQRNKVLKSGGEESMLVIYDQQMKPYAELLERVRRESIERILPLVNRYYEMLSGARESVGLEYKSQLEVGGDFVSLMESRRERDLYCGYTTAGVHRDELLFTIGDGLPLRKYGSQGQQKSFLVTLKLAQYQLISEQRGERPILLLDDLFDKLDRTRVERLIRLVAGDDFGQIFISDCNQERLHTILDRADVEYNIFVVDRGAVALQGDCPIEKEEDDEKN